MKRDIRVVTTEAIPGRSIVKTLGLVRGSSVRARHIGRDITALARNIVGGEVPEYSELMAVSREQALERMKAEAEKLGANAVVSTRFATASIMQGAAEILAYGTAIVME